MGSSPVSRPSLFMNYIIVNKNDASLCWSNTVGWTDGDNYETFSEEEKEIYSLPIEGRWEEVPWKKVV